MIHPILPAQRLPNACGLVIPPAAILIAILLVHASATRTLAALPPIVGTVTATDFWAKTGATSKHDFDADAVAELEKLVKDANRPELSLRATKLLCDQAGHSRMNPDLRDADNIRAVTVAFEYLESHLADAEVAKYAPARGFTHMSISSKAGDGDGMAWVLIETAALPPSFNGGLNIRVDLKASKVTGVKQWGDVRPAPAKQ